jgi:hypothetical protein
LPADRFQTERTRFQEITVIISPDGLCFQFMMQMLLPTGFVGRHPDDRGVRWLKQQTREVPLSARSWLYGIEKARRYIRQYRTIILVEGIFDYFAFYQPAPRPGQTGGGFDIGFLSHPRGGEHSKGP